MLTYSCPALNFTKDDSEQMLKLSDDSPRLYSGNKTYIAIPE